MKYALKIAVIFLVAILALLASTTAWYLHTKQPQRQGSLPLKRLTATVSVRYDERGVPHLQAQNEADLYRALGYVQAQDRLFQMELMRRIAKGELAAIFGSKQLDNDKLMRTLGIGQRARELAAALDPESAPAKALLAYLDGVNQYQDSHRPPLEFDILRIPRRPFTAQDSFAVAGYFAYSNTTALKTEPVLTFVRDRLGPQYLKIFDIDWHPEGVLAQGPVSPAQSDSLARLARFNQDCCGSNGWPTLEGSNGWVLAGGRTASGKPLLAGDPHSAYTLPALWYEAHLTAPGFDLYGHHLPLNPFAMLGHNRQFGWTLTMFQNDDMDLVAEKVNPDNPEQVWDMGQWNGLSGRNEVIQVRGGSPVNLMLRQSPHGPIITDLLQNPPAQAPIALWWTFLQADNTLLDAFYALNRADEVAKARDAASKIQSPGFNVMWASGNGDIAWWAAAKLPQRPAGVNPVFVLDAGKGEAEKPGYYSFAFNPQEENPARGYIMSANHQPKPGNGVPVPGYYSLADRAQRLDDVLRDPNRKWDTLAAQQLQIDPSNGYALRVLGDLLPTLKQVVTDANERAFLEPLEKWDGFYGRDSIAATLFTQLMYELARAALADELGEVQFDSLLHTRAIDGALARLVADPKSPWWDDVKTPQKENHFEIARLAWSKTLTHLQSLYGSNLVDWTWGKSHTLTHLHALAWNRPLGWLFDVGPFALAGSRETPNNQSFTPSPGPWPVNFGPSARRVIDFGDPARATGINPVGQSGVLFDAHYSDQAGLFSEGLYQPMHLSDADVKQHTASTLTLTPSP